MPKLKVRKGQRFNAWKVIEEAESVKYSKVTIRHFRCECSCGHEAVVALTNLRSGASPHCKNCMRGKVKDEATALAILKAAGMGVPFSVIARRHGVSNHIVYNIVSGRTWSTLARE